MGTDISTRTEYKPKNLTRKEKASTRDHIKALASAHAEKAITKLSEILADKRSPANAKIAAASALLDRTCGKPKFQDEKETETTQLDKMTVPELVEYISQQFSGVPAHVRAIIMESLDTGLAFDAGDIAEEIKEEQHKGLPPLIKPKREPKIPRR